MILLLVQFVIKGDNMSNIIEYIKNEIEKTKELINHAKKGNNPTEVIAWRHTLVAYLDILYKLENK